MKNIFLIKRHSKYSDENFEWITLSGHEFREYLKSDSAEGKRFARIPYDIEGNKNIFYEADPSEYAEWRVENRHFEYLRENEAESGYTLISYNAIELDVDCNGEEILVDESADVECETIHKLDLETLRKALDSLSDDEYNLIFDLYLSEKPLTVRELGEKLGVHFVTISKRKKKIFEKIKKYYGF